ncbi:MAG: class II fructose-bisphosphate aldolase [Candidatus Cloacimonetes bacterium]|nr:class II fructose-bisphosphate aldolase [Candidatus Cloacimonadota bacterium]
MKNILTQAQSNGFALGAFNAGNLETIKAIVNATQNLNTAVIVELSPGEVEFMGMEIAAAVLHTWKENLQTPLFINLDHGKDPDEVKAAVDLGFDLVHFDGTSLPFEENVRITQELVDYAHTYGALVEGEVDKIPETSIPHKEPAEKIAKGLPMTDPVQAAFFVEKTGVDIFAPFVGNLHGTYETAEKIDWERLKEIRKKVPCFLSLHGGSGISDKDIRKAIEVGGVVKINVNTELRIAYRKALEETLRQADSVKMYEIMPEVVESVQKVVEQKLKSFKSPNERIRELAN